MAVQNTLFLLSWYDTHIIRQHSRAVKLLVDKLKILYWEMLNMLAIQPHVRPDKYLL
jgi:hypothetical protein